MPKRSRYQWLANFCVVAWATLFFIGVSNSSTAAEPPRIKLLFLGDQGHHQPAVRFKQLQPVMAARGIDLVYSDLVSDLNPNTLKDYAGVVVYANIDRIEPEQAKALLDYVASGKGFIPLHCASYCFRNSDEVVALMGAQFQRHGTGIVRTTIAAPDHPVMRGFKGFASFDETYVHTKHNPKDRTVLEYRQEGTQQEPWTWVRTHGQGRVFYTAWGHDDRTWANPGFQNLVERGIRWAVGQDPAVVPAYPERPEMTALRKDAKPFEYIDANIPFYPAGKQWGTLEKGARKMQLPVSPEESMKHMVTPVGFEIKLFAAEKSWQGKPVFMTWDERGRLWTCETVDYPNELQAPGTGRDRIRISEDTNGDFVADKFTIFAEQLSIPTAIAFYRGGAIVQNGTETIYLKDTNGDDRADLRKVLVKGWALGDTHGGVSNFQYGLDNWYYGMQGYNNSQPELTDGRKLTSFRQGFFRFKLEGEGEQVAVTEMEFLRSTNNNTWGLGISEEGLIFGSTANGNPSEFMPIPNRNYEAVRGWSATVLSGIADSNQFEALDPEVVRQVDHHGGFTAAAGHALYTARNYPQEYWNRAAFVTEPTGHLCATFILRPDGSGFRSRNSWNLLASNDEWTAPIMAEVGPDGNVWILDWYNFIVQHNPTPAGFKTGKGNAYESDLRDKKHGRVYRLTYSNPHSAGKEPAVTAAPIQSLANAKPAELVDALRSDNFFWRRHAQRLLVERGQQDVVPQLIEVARNQHVDAVGLNTGVNHALWTLQGLQALNGSNTTVTAQAIADLRHPSAGVRRNAVQVVPKTAAALTAILDANLLNDKDQPVRLATLLAIADMPASEAAGDAIRVAFVTSAVGDRWLQDAAICAAARHDIHFLRSVVQNSGAVLASPPVNALTIIAEHYARGLPVETAAALVASLGNAKSNVSEPILIGLANGWPKNKSLDLDVASDKALVELLTKLPPTSRGALVNLALRWGSKSLEAHVAEISKGFLEIASNDKQKEADRITAARQLIEFRRLDAKAALALIQLITPRSSTELAQGLLEAAGISESPETGSSIISSLPALTPAVRPAAVRILLSRTDWTRALLDGIEKGQVQVTELSLDQKQSLAAHVDKEIRDRAKPMLAKGGGLPNPDRQKVVEELMPLTRMTGDPVAGKLVFKKTCAKCHTHGGEGAKIGPDLTGMAVHPKPELLIHIIDPSRSVEGNFRIYTVATDDGKVYSGLLASESKTAIEVIDVEAKKHSILRENIEELVASQKSLMPEGFEKQHTKDELVNLLEFLTQRGKFLPIPLDKLATVVSTKGMFIDERADAERLIFPDWSPKTVEGVPFVLVDPHGDRTPNALLMYSTNGTIPNKMPKKIMLPCNAPAKAIHLLSGVSGWGFPIGEKGSVSLIVRLHYADGEHEDHELKNGEHFADYIRRVDVPNSKLAFMLRGQQIRFLSVFPKRPNLIKEIELVKGPDQSAPVVMAVTIEGQ
ncbi:MAG: Trehalose utilization [Planctomycetaceae bacterium]|nr:Trehalose utilization [Planctomycetaceae bacterium]